MTDRPMIVLWLKDCFLQRESEEWCATICLGGSKLFGMVIMCWFWHFACWGHRSMTQTECGSHAIQYVSKYFLVRPIAQTTSSLDQSYDGIIGFTHHCYFVRMCCAWALSWIKWYDLLHEDKRHYCFQVAGEQFESPWASREAAGNATSRATHSLCQNASVSFWGQHTEIQSAVSLQRPSARRR